MLSWCVLLAAAASATPVCPSGDAPAEVSDLVVDDVRFDVEIGADDVARVRTHLRLKNTSGGPGLARVVIAVEAPHAPVVATRARLRGDKAATLVDDVTAAESDFEAFAAALQVGVAPEAARAGRKRTALLVAHVDGGYEVRVAAACSARVVDVDVDAVVAADHHDGVARFTLPLLSPRTQVAVASERSAWIGGQRATSRRFTVDEDLGDGINDHDSVDVEVNGADVFGPQLVSAIATRRRAPLPIADDTQQVEASRAPFTVAHTALSLPDPLSATPAELRVVFVVDASVSAADGGLDRALAIAKDVVRALPADAGYALVAAGRTPRLVVPPWQPAGRWRVPHIDVDNGSELPAAVALAHTMARDALPGSGRVIVLSDLQLATHHVEDHALARRLVSGPLVHVVALAADVGVDETEHEPLSWARVFGDDGDSQQHSDVAAAAEGTGGMLLLVNDGNSDGDDRGVLARSLVRPTSFDRPTLVFGGDDETRNTVWHVNDDVSAFEWPLVLREGEGIAASMVVDGSSDGRVEGYLWGTKVVLPLVSSSDRAMRATLFGRAVNRDLSLDDDIVRAVAVADHFVSPATALLRVPPFRPATVDEVGMAFRCGGCRGACGAGSSDCGYGHRKGRTAALAEADILAKLGAQLAVRCGVNVDADIEVEDLEILRVDVRLGGACVHEALWATRLDQLTPGDGSFEAHSTRTVTGTRTRTP